MGNNPACCQGVKVPEDDIQEPSLDDATTDQSPVLPKPASAPESVALPEPAAIREAAAPPPEDAPPPIEEEKAAEKEDPLALLPIQEESNAVTEAPAAPEAAKQAEVPWQQQKWNEYIAADMVDKEKSFFEDLACSSSTRRPSSSKHSFPEYLDQHAVVFAKARNLESNDGWLLKKSVGGVDIYTKSVAGEDLLYSKGVTTLKTHGKGIRHLIAHMLTAEDRPEYDEVCESGQTIESYLPWYRTIRFVIKSPTSIIAQRDVVTLSRICFEKDGGILLATESVDHPACPEKSPYVRASVMGAYIIRPTSDPDEWKIMFALSSDPRGWLPGWVKNLIAWKAQLALVNFKKFYDDSFGRA